MTQKWNGSSVRRWNSVVNTKSNKNSKKAIIQQIRQRRVVRLDLITGADCCRKHSARTKASSLKRHQMWFLEGPIMNCAGFKRQFKDLHSQFLSSQVEAVIESRATASANPQLDGCGREEYTPSELATPNSYAGAI
jgi:hypothetical protein